MSRNQKVRAGVIGLSMGYHHASGFAQNPNSELVAVCDMNFDRVQRVVNELGPARVYDRYEDLLKDEEIDVVSVCVPNYLHLPITLQALKQGKHVLCEKPMAMNASEAQKMVQASRKANKKLMIAFHNRFNAEAKALKKYIDSGDLGEIYYLKAAWMRRMGIPGSGWFRQKAEAGGGALIDIGVHVLDLALWFAGNPKPTQVLGTTCQKFGHVVKDQGVYDVDDLGVGLIKLDSGATLFLEASWATHIQQEYISVEVMGTRGGAKLYPLAIFTNQHDMQVNLQPQAGGPPPHIEEVNHFVDCILHDTEPIATGEQGMEVMRILDAIYKSSETGKAVNLG